MHRLDSKDLYTSDPIQEQTVVKSVNTVRKLENSPSLSGFPLYTVNT